jgi:hypothetical protein
VNEPGLKGSFGLGWYYNPGLKGFPEKQKKQERIRAPTYLHVLELNSISLSRTQTQFCTYQKSYNFFTKKSYNFFIGSYNISRTHTSQFIQDLHNTSSISLTQKIHITNMTDSQHKKLEKNSSKSSPCCAALSSGLGRMPPGTGGVVPAPARVGHRAACAPPRRRPLPPAPHPSAPLRRRPQRRRPRAPWPVAPAPTGRRCVSSGHPLSVQERIR